MMFKEKKKPLFSAVLLLTSLGIATSCIDNSYDLDKDIDMTINVGGEHLAFPVGSTEKIMMDKIIEIDDGDDLQVVNGEYHLLKKGTVDDANTDVKEVTVEGSLTEIAETEITNITSPLPTNTLFSKEINETNQITAEANNIDEAVKEIGSLTAKNPVELVISLKVNAGRGVIHEPVQIPDLKITLPDFLDLEEDAYLSGHTLNLSNINIPQGEVYTYKLRLKGYKFEDGRPVVGQSLTIKENVTVTGDAKVTIQAYSEGAIAVVPTVELKDMPIKSVTGIIQPAIDETGSTVELSNLPDFLQDDDVELDIINPVFTFIATNPLNAPVVLNGEMYGTKEGRKIDGSTVVIGENSVDKAPIVLEPNATTTIALSRLGTGGPEGSKNIKVSDINNLIKKIPDVVDVKLQPAITYDEYYTVELGKTYSMNSSYDIDIPLDFGSGLKIVYKDSINDLHSDLEDIDFKKAVIAVTADNTIPLQLEIKENNVTVKDFNGKRMDDIKVTVEGTIAESKDVKAVATSQLTITMEETKEGAIGNLEELVFKITAVPGQATNVQLRSDQWLQLKDMKLKVPNGIKIDLN